MAVLVIPFLFHACKVAKRTTSQDPKPTVDSVAVVLPEPPTIDSVALVVQDSVEIGIHRLLKDTVAIIGVGDIMMGTNYPSEDYLPPAGGKHLFDSVSAVLQNADITFGNLEGVILDSGGQPKSCRNPKTCYLFRTPNSYIAHLVNAGFDVVSVANNHAGDFGDEGRASTAHVLDSVAIEFAGFDSKPYAIFLKEGMKYGFAAFAPNNGTISIHDQNQAREIIQHLDSVADIVIVSFHGGAEGGKYQNVTRKNEFFYGEDRGNVYQFAHNVIDWGADIVFGHGPHVTRAIDIYKNRFITYSLGNFCTYARFNLRGPNGIAPIIKVLTTSSGEFISGVITPVVLAGRGVPWIDSKKRAISKIQELNAEDFPELKINIDANGIITYLQNP